VLAPYDAEDSRGLLKAAIRDPDPVVFLENEILYGESFPVTDKILDHDFTVPIGKCKVRMAGLAFSPRQLRAARPVVQQSCMQQAGIIAGVLTACLPPCQVMREGTDVTLVAFGKLVGYNLKVAEELEKEGISCEVCSSTFWCSCPP
jgi:pyruvate dehydrogenase E1 component beta subunit